MTAGDLAQFVGFFFAMTAAASCLSCLVDRSLHAWRATQLRDED